MELTTLCVRSPSGHALSMKLPLEVSPHPRPLHCHGQIQHLSRTSEPYNPIKQDTKNGRLREYEWGDMCWNYGAFPQVCNPRLPCLQLFCLTALFHLHFLHRHGKTPHTSTLTRSARAITILLVSGRLWLPHSNVLLTASLHFVLTDAVGIGNASLVFRSTVTSLIFAFVWICVRLRLGAVDGALGPLSL